MASELVSLEMICKVIDLTPQRVLQLVKEGVIPKHERGRYELVPVVNAYVQFLRKKKIVGNVHGDDYSTHRTRLTKGRADIIEMEKAQMESRLIPAEDVEQTWTSIVSNTRNRLISIPTKVAPAVFASNNLNEIRDIIKDEIYAALDELSDAEVRTLNPIHGSESEGDDEEDIEGLEVSAKSQGERLGRSESEVIA